MVVAKNSVNSAVAKKLFKQEQDMMSSGRLLKFDLRLRRKVPFIN